MVVLWDISTGKIGPAQVLCEFQLLQREVERGWREGWGELCNAARVILENICFILAYCHPALIICVTCSSRSLCLIWSSTMLYSRNPFTTEILLNLVSRASSCICLQREEKENVSSAHGLFISGYLPSCSPLTLTFSFKLNHFTPSLAPSHKIERIYILLFDLCCINKFISRLYLVNFKEWIPPELNF